jgi:hypothetical protein
MIYIVDSRIVVENKIQSISPSTIYTMCAIQNYYLPNPSLKRTEACIVEQE